MQRTPCYDKKAPDRRQGDRAGVTCDPTTPGSWARLRGTWATCGGRSGRRPPGTRHPHIGGRRCTLPGHAPTWGSRRVSWTPRGSLVSFRPGTRPAQDRLRGPTTRERPIYQPRSRRWLLGHPAQSYDRCTGWYRQKLARFATWVHGQRPENEGRSLEKYLGRFRLYRVFDFGRVPRVYVMPGPLRRDCLEPVVYRASV